MPICMYEHPLRGDPGETLASSHYPMWLTVQSRDGPMIGTSMRREGDMAMYLTATVLDSKDARALATCYHQLFPVRT
jgi:hypothetical protein